MICLHGVSQGVTSVDQYGAHSCLTQSVHMTRLHDYALCQLQSERYLSSPIFHFASCRLCIELADIIPFQLEKEADQVHRLKEFLQ